MTQFRSSQDAPRPPAARCNAVHDRTLLGLLFVTLVRTSQALAGDQASLLNAAANPAAGFHQSSPAAAALLTDPEFFSVPRTADAPVYSATDFRPRKSPSFDHDSSISAVGDAPMLRSTTVWQRLSEYRSHDRVRVLTLWETRGSTVSLQAGKRGEPSLQWSSRLMNRDGATRGLLDRLFSVSLAGAGNGARSTSHAASSPPGLKPTLNPVRARLDSNQ
jgi:hypothetical protein